MFIWTTTALKNIKDDLTRGSLDFRCDVTILSSLLIKTYCRILVLASFFLVRLEKLVNIHRLSKSDLLCCVKLTLFQLKYTTLNEAGQGKCVQCIPIYYISQWLDSNPWEDPPSSKILVCPQSKLQVLKQVQNRLKKSLFLIPRCNATLLKETRIHACITQKVDFQRHYFLNYRKKLRISASRTHTLDRLFLMNVLNLFLQTGY